MRNITEKEREKKKNREREKEGGRETRETRRKKKKKAKKAKSAKQCCTIASRNAAHGSRVLCFASELRLLASESYVHTP
jgi:hypothetical protein